MVAEQQLIGGAPRHEWPERLQRRRQRQESVASHAQVRATDTHEGVGLEAGDVARLSVPELGGGVARVQPAQ